MISIGAGIGVFLLWITPVPGWMHLGAPVASFVPVGARGTLRWDLIAGLRCRARSATDGGAFLALVPDALD